MQNSKSMIAAPPLLSPKNQDEDGKRISLFHSKNISPERQEQIRAGLRRDFDQIFDPAIHEVDPAVNECDPADGVAA